MPKLSRAQRDKVQQFAQVAGCDARTAQHCLEASGWSQEGAFEVRQGVQVVGARAPEVGGRRRTSVRAGAGLTRAWPLDLLQPVRPCGREGGHSGARGAFRQGKDPWRAWGGVDGRGRARGWHAALPSLRGVWAYALCAQEAASAVQHAARRGARACSSRDRCSRSAIAAHPVRSTRAHRAAGGGVCILRSPRPNNRRCCSHLPR